LRSPLWSVMGLIGGTRKGCPYGVALVVGRGLRSAMGLILGTRKGCPYAVALVIVVARAVGHGSHRGHPPVFVNHKARHLIIKKRVSWMDERLKVIMRKRVNRS